MKRLIFFYGLMMLIPCVAMQSGNPGSRDSVSEDSSMSAPERHRCAICRQVISGIQTTLTCGHTFCEECLIQRRMNNLEVSGTCPTCGREILRSDRWKFISIPESVAGLNLCPSRAVFKAVEHGDTEQVRTLLDQNVFLQEFLNRLHYIAVSGNHKAIACLLVERGADVTTFNDQAAYQAVIDRNTEQVRTLLDQNVFSQEVLNNLLYFAVSEYSNEENVHMLVEHGADVTTLNYVIQRDEGPIFDYLRKHGAWSLSWRLLNFGKKVVKKPLTLGLLLYCNITGQGF